MWFNGVKVYDGGPKGTMARYRLMQEIRAVAAQRRGDQMRRHDAGIARAMTERARSGPPAGASPDIVKGWR